MEEEEGNIYVGGQYWDSIIWMICAREYCRFHKDDNFYRLAFEAGRNSVHRREEDEFDEEDGLFRGPAVYGDGIAAYPDKYSKCPNQGSGILEWVDYPGNPVYPKGYGIPMKALSTNCVYFKAYEILAEMAHALGEPAKEFEEKAAAMKKAVNKKSARKHKCRAKPGHPVGKTKDAALLPLRFACGHCARAVSRRKRAKRGSCCDEDTKTIRVHL